MKPSPTPSPLQELQQRLTPVRRRLAAKAVLLACARGWWLGAMVALWLALLLWIGRELGVWPGAYWVLWPGGAVGAIILGLLVGLCMGIRRAPTWLSAAAAVDAHFGLRDAVVAGIQFAERAGETGLRPMEAMQVGQTVRTLDELDLSAAVRLRVPKSLYGGTLLLAVAAAVFAWTIWLGPPPERAAETVRQADKEIQPLAQRVPVAEPARRDTVEMAVEWQVAPRGEVRGGRTGLRFNETLEQAVRAAAADRPAEPTPSASAAVPDRVPPEYRPIVRRYFERDRREK
jgi:hypothetical protein